MTVDAVLSRELNSLHEELLASRQPSAAAMSGETAQRDSQPEERAHKAEEPGLQEELHGFVNVITKFIEDAEKNLSEHPAANLVGALIVGILIGRLLGRR